MCSCFFFSSTSFIFEVQKFWPQKFFKPSHVLWDLHFPLLFLDFLSHCSRGGVQAVRQGDVRHGY